MCNKQGFITTLFLALLFIIIYFLLPPITTASVSFVDGFSGNNTTLQQYNSNYQSWEGQIYVDEDHAYTNDGFGAFAIYTGFSQTNNCTSIDFRSDGWVSILLRTKFNFLQTDRIDLIDGSWWRYFHNSNSVTEMGNLSSGLTFDRFSPTIHTLKACASGTTLTAYIDNQQFWTGQSTNTGGYSGFGAYEPTSYLDNFKIETILSGLEVPYFSQNANPWGPSEYDHTIALGATAMDATMDRWGCAVTSAAMILRYHGMDEISNGTPLDPGSLNNWLKNNKGYLTGKTKDGWYSYLSWPSISKLTKQLYDIGKSNTKLEYKRAPQSQMTDLLNNDLQNDIPAIVHVTSRTGFNGSIGHFVVATGVQNNTHIINDPEWNYSTLASFNNYFDQVDRYIPSNTNLSYINLVVNPEVEILVTDDQGRKTGKIIKDGQTQTFSQIPDAIYGYESSIDNPDPLSLLQRFGTGVHSFLLPKPENGTYTFTISGGDVKDFALNVALFESDGDDTLTPLHGYVGQYSEESFQVSFDQSNLAEVTRQVNFDSLINDTYQDVYQQRESNGISRDNISNHLLRLLTQTAKEYRLGRYDHVNRKLDQFEDLLNREKGNWITEDAYQGLMEDLTALRAQIQ